MLLLALDTSTHQASIALCLEDELCGEYSWHIGNNHSVALLVNIQRLVAECGKSVRDIEAVAVARGPGSFNGLRVALATAKTLAFTLNIPLVGACTLDIIATQQRQWHGPICAVLEAGRSELYAACYVFDEMHSGSSDVTYTMRRLSDYLLLTPQRLGSYLQDQSSEWLGVPGERQLPSFLFCGELSQASREALYIQMQDKSLFTGSIQATRHASTLALLALQLLREGKEDDPLLLEPLYLRRPSITTSARKQPLLGGLTHRPAGQSIAEREEGALRH
jgi:tRNA threonylcarbamoyladenosine biosynthesis protein TsaB